MRRTEKQKKHRKIKTSRIIAIVVIVAAVAGLLSQTVFAQNSYIITDGGNVTVHKTFSSNPETVLNEAGIELSEEDTYTTTYKDGGYCIDIQRMQKVTVINRGSSSVINTYGESVGDLIDRMGIVLEENDVLSCGDDMQTYDGMTVKIVRKEVQRLQYDEKIPYETKVYEDPELAPGEEVVLVEGADGVMHYDAEVTYENGIEVSREIFRENVVTDSVTKLVVKGPDRETAMRPGEEVRENDNGSETEQPLTSSEPTPTSGPTPPVARETVPPTTVPTSPTESNPGSSSPSASGNVLTTASGATYAYSQALTVSCTAYTCGGSIGYTYSGTVARVGAVAVDPNYIPLGTRMYIVSNDGQYVYGYCVAEDIGGGIVGNKIDLYFNTYSECWAFGVRTCTAYILK